MKRFLALVILACAGFAQVVLAAPSVKEVDDAVRAGNYAQAESLLAEAVQAHPDSARARYMYGQVLDHNGKAAAGLAQIEQSRTLDPSLSFTDPARFRAVERHVQANADAAGGNGNGSANGGSKGAWSGSLAAGNGPNGLSTGGSLSRGAAQVAPDAVAPVSHAPSSKIWIIFIIVIAGVAGVLVWTVRRAHSKGDGEAKETRLTQMRRSTEVLNGVRSLKLDLRLSTAAGHEQLTGEAENLETDARETVDALNTGNPVPDYRVEDLERRLASLRARAEGRPDPTLAMPATNNGGASPYAQEADRYSGQPYPNGPGQPTVIVQQQPSSGSGLLTGVLLGSVLSGGFGGERDRVVERDVIVDDERRRNGGDNVPDPGFDPGQGGNDWDSGGGGIDTGSGDDGSWSDN